MTGHMDAADAQAAFEEARRREEAIPTGISWMAQRHAVRERRIRAAAVAAEAWQALVDRLRADTALVEDAQARIRKATTAEEVEAEAARIRKAGVRLRRAQEQIRRARRMSPRVAR